MEPTLSLNELRSEKLVVISTHPIQYHAPVYREVQRLGLPVTAIYGSDFSVAGYHDREFDVAFSWSTDLLSGYSSVFLSRVADGGAKLPEATSAWRLSAALEQLAPAAVLVTGYWPSYFRQAIVQLLYQRRRILFRAETTDHARARRRLKEAMRDALLRSFYAKCSALLYIGEKSRSHYTRLGVKAESMYFSPYCVDASVFDVDEGARERLRDSTRSELEIAPDQKVLIFSGKLVPRKGPDLLVEAVAGMPAELKSRVTIVFLGAGEMRESLQARADDVNMRFVGFQNQHQLSRYYHASDALVLPSRSGETWGLVVNEALLHGVPCVVSTEVGCAPDLVVSDETGEIFTNNSAQSLREALSRLLHWPQEEMTVRERCRSQVGRYSVSAAARGIVEAFDGSLRIDESRSARTP